MGIGRKCLQGEVWRDLVRDRDAEVFGKRGGELQDLGLPLWAWTALRPEERKKGQLRLRGYDLRVGIEAGEGGF